MRQKEFRIQRTSNVAFRSAKVAFLRSSAEPKSTTVFRPIFSSGLLAAVGFMLMFACANAANNAQPLAAESLVFAEKDGLVAVEAEHFFKQQLTDKRAFLITSSQSAPSMEPDGDPPHLGGAAGGAYVEVLPDSRRNHSEKLINGENFSNEPGKLAVLTYKVHFENPGRYYVWVRAYSSGSEDNGIHVGIDGTWPESGRRMQWCEGKKTWRWESKQRTDAEHCGEPYKIFLDVPAAGIHEIHFSMREDGFEVDRWLMTQNRDFERPEGIGPQVAVHAGVLPTSFPNVEPTEQTVEAKPAAPALALPRQADGKGSVAVSGELKQWHKVSLTLDGPYAHELDSAPNPFTDRAFQVTFTHASGSPSYQVPGYFAADGNASETSAESGTKWRAHLSPDKTGEWNYAISFKTGKLAALDGGGESLKPFDGVTGSFTIAASDKTGRDFRGLGRLTYVGEHYLKFAGSQQYFLKAGPDAPETLLGYVDFDNTLAGKPDKVPLKSWQPHVADWKAGDPSWKNGKGKGLVGALNYLASKGVNSFSFLPYNAGGDGDNIWPFVSRDDKLHWDCSKLDQWGIVFDHGTAKGLYLHFKLQENEMDDDRQGHESTPGRVPESLDGGKLGPERKLYCRELIARFAHELALNWNIGEENTQSPDEVRDMVRYLHDTDPYKHNIVIHTFPDQQDKVYTALLGDQSLLTGASLQNSWNQAHQRTLQWVTESEKSGRLWVVANDEQGPASDGVPADPGYQGNDGTAELNGKKYTLHDVRKLCLWGTLMAGGAGVEYYFGYKLPENDLVCEDFRSRDRSWDYCRIALEFFPANKIPFWQMKNADELVGNAQHDNSKFCFAKSGEVYLVYLPDGGTSTLNLSAATGDFKVAWFNPRTGGALAAGSVASVAGGGVVELGMPPAEGTEDWLAVVRR